jgi:NAD(P)-dependent dehydrogenase (short-subunit alcohol dehydrogenase family)
MLVIAPVCSGFLRNRFAKPDSGRRIKVQVMARAFSEQGARVAVADINLEPAEKTVEEIRAKGGVGSAIAVDVADPQSVDCLLKEVLRVFKQVDVLVNNAAIEVDKTIEHTTLAEWNREVSVNLGGVFLCSKCFLPELRKTKGKWVDFGHSRMATPLWEPLRRLIGRHSDQGLLGINDQVTRGSHAFNQEEPSL